MDCKFPVRQDSTINLFGQIPEPIARGTSPSPEPTVRSLTPTFEFNRKLSFSKSVTEAVDQIVISVDQPAETKSQDEADTKARMDLRWQNHLLNTRNALPAMTGPTRLQRLCDFCKEHKGEIALAALGTTAVAAVAVVVAYLVAPDT